MTGGAEGFEVRPVTGIGDVKPGDDLATLITTAAPWLRDGDILVVTSKIVSKAEGQLVEIPLDEPARQAAREAILRAETVRVVARRGATRIVQTHHGFVLAAAGIDASNVDPTRVVLLPKDPDASARWLRDELRERFGLDVAVVITDTMGRPWRLGLTDVAIGAAGVDALTDYRGQRDAYGNELQLTQMAVIDELAAAADLVKGKTGQVPVAVVRGLPIRAEGHGTGAAELIRGADADLFSLGTAEAIARGLRESAEIADAPAFAPPAAIVNLDLEHAGHPRPAADPASRVGGPGAGTGGHRVEAGGSMSGVDEMVPGAAALPEAARAGLESAGADTAGAALGFVGAGGLRLPDLPFPQTRSVAVPDNTAVAIVAWAPAGDLRRAVEVGMEIHRLRAVLAADGLASAWIEIADGRAVEADIPEGGVPLGVLAIGRGSLPSL